MWEDAILVVAGAVLGIVLERYVKRPKLEPVGGGSGGVGLPGVSIHTLSIANPPGLIGIRLGPTMIHRKKIIPGLYERGLTVIREPAMQCQAELYDSETGEGVGQLWWRSEGRFEQTVDILCGESRELAVFTRAAADRSPYFPYFPDDQTTGHPRIPYRPSFDETRDFDVLLTYDRGRRRRMIWVTTHVSLGGRIDWRHPHNRPPTGFFFKKKRMP